ncbi:MAG: cobalamin biosynthesis protein [Desulfuromonas sp.]|nr:cobalamin biosynthesis protein [Desulfuromonas sp.]
MKIAVITFSEQGLKVMEQIAADMEVDQYLHHAIKGSESITPFERVYALTAEIFQHYSGLVYIAPCGVVVRAIAPLIQHKLKDPAVVCLDVGARHAMSVLSGHEGGANDLAIKVGNLTGAEPVISTTTEAVKDLIVGIGCRKGKPADEIKAAISAALNQIGEEIAHVRYLATADVKGKEPGLLQAAAELEIPLRIIDSKLIRISTLPFGHSDFVEQNVNLPAVSEPAALLCGRRTSLLLQKTAFNGITIAIARENCTSLA